MILTAFDVKFNEKKNELPPGACRHSKKLEKTMFKKRSFWVITIVEESVKNYVG